MNQGDLIDDLHFLLRIVNFDQLTTEEFERVKALIDAHNIQNPYMGPNWNDYKHTETPLSNGWESDQCPECKDILGHKSSCARQFDNDEDF